MFYRGGLVEAPKVKASFGTHPGTWGRIQGRGDTRQGRRKASIIGHQIMLLGGGQEQGGEYLPGRGGFVPGGMMVVVVALWWEVGDLMGHPRLQQKPVSNPLSWCPGKPARKPDLNPPANPF